MLEEEIDIELNTVNPQITSNNTETSPPGRQQGFVTHGDMEADGNNDILPPSTYLELYENRPSAEPLPSVFTTDMLSLDLLLAEGLSPGPEIDLDDIDLDGMQHWSQIFHTP
ncbi:uncharacterized protein N7484_000524 [Penicillium longicatenatum]|uniref:uncharacterized protein n=1 Tax=Penicillium longicatenatum TaxID=1561947 RepID=UPI002549661F|nr:uncharacterized protein N7484_000524 [Penicillium longicatenatum]KAJ5661152.1 hypothetical protein N7484_000524 [Penicillium longicatenatum]